MVPKKALADKLRGALKTAQKHSKKYFLKQSDFPRLHNRATALLKKRFEKKALAEKLRGALETVQQHSKKYFLKQSHFPRLRNSATASLKKRLSRKAERCVGDCATAVKKLFSEAV